MSNYWYVYKDEERFGPYTREQLEDQAKRGTLNLTDLVWNELIGDWVPAREVDGLFAAPPPPPAPDADEGPPPPRLDTEAPSLPSSPIIKPEAPPSPSSVDVQDGAVTARGASQQGGKLAFFAGFIFLLVLVIGFGWWGMGTFFGGPGDEVGKPTPEIPAAPAEDSKPAIEPSEKADPDAQPEASPKEANIVDSITGIDPGVGVMVATKDAIDIYDLQVKLIEGGYDEMTAELASAIDNQEWIVVTGWAPHWKFVQWDLKFLEDPELIYGGKEYIANVTRLGLADDHPVVHELLQNFSWGDDEFGAVIAMNREDGDFLGNAQTWIDENRGIVDGWIPEGLEGNGTEIEILTVRWECATASTFTVAAVLEEAGYKVDITPVDADFMWSSVAEGNADFFVCGWSEAHDHYIQKYGNSVDIAGKQYEDARIGLVVPRYMPINSITEINEYTQ